MGRPRRYTPAVRERAVRLTREHGPEHVSQRAAITSIASTLGCTRTFSTKVGIRRQCEGIEAMRLQATRRPDARERRLGESGHTQCYH